MTESTFVVSPLWFDIERLKEVSYNAEEYVTELRRYVPLDAISTQLETYLTQLKLQVDHSSTYTIYLLSLVGRSYQ